MPNLTVVPTLFMKYNKMLKNMILPSKQHVRWSKYTTIFHVGLFFACKFFHFSMNTSYQKNIPSIQFGAMVKFGTMDLALWETFWRCKNKIKFSGFGALFETSKR